MFEALKARKEALDEKLRKKSEELRLLCLQEGVSFYHYCLFFNKQYDFSYVAYVYINGHKHWWECEKSKKNFYIRLKISIKHNIFVINIPHIY